MRLLTKILLILIVMPAAVGVFCAYRLFGCQAISGLHPDTVSDQAADSAESFENRITDKKNE